MVPMTTLALNEFTQRGKYLIVYLEAKRFWVVRCPTDTSCFDLRNLLKLPLGNGEYVATTSHFLIEIWSIGLCVTNDVYQDSVV